VQCTVRQTSDCLSAACSHVNNQTSDGSGLIIHTNETYTYTYTYTHVQLAPMSTTTDMKTAIDYSISKESLLFKIVTRNKLQRGADLQWVSAFPSETEILYPPLTYLQPTGRTQVVQVDACRVTVVEVYPTLA